MVGAAGLCPDRVAAAIRPSLTAVRLGTADELRLVGVLHDVHRTSLAELGPAKRGLYTSTGK